MVVGTTAESADVVEKSQAVVERNTLLFVEPTATSIAAGLLDETSGTTAAVAKDEDDAFFELTADDMRARNRELVARVWMETNRPLLPQAYLNRKNEELKRRAYRHAVVRFALPRQRVVVQARFLATEPVSALFDFVGQLLLPATGGGFKLLLGRQRLASNDRRTLLAAEVAPASRLIIHLPADGPPVDIDALATSTRRISEADADEDRRLWLTANSDFQSFERQLVEADVELCVDDSAATATKRAAALILGRGGAGQQRPSTSSGIGSASVPKWFKKN